jgi:hypothetical protein
MGGLIPDMAPLPKALSPDFPDKAEANGLTPDPNPPNPEPRLGFDTDANGDCIPAEAPKADSVLLRPSIGGGDLVPEARVPNGVLLLVDVLRVPNGEVLDFASLLKDEASNADCDVFAPESAALLPESEAKGETDEELVKPLGAESLSQSQQKLKVFSKYQQHTAAVFEPNPSTFSFFDSLSLSLGRLAPRSTSPSSDCVADVTLSILPVEETLSLME